MSAAVLRNPWRVQSIEDDRESAVHVLTLLALCYSNHDELNLASYLAVYNQVDHRLSKDIITGGLRKGDQLGSAMFSTFTSDPLNRLLDVLGETFSVRYGKSYSDDAIKKGKDILGSPASVDPTYLHLIGAYLYGSKMEVLEKPNWLVEVFNEQLNSHDWPSGDNAKANTLT
jgi:hypothetical protein